ncbi:MAG TPA: preprotein translocase subunit SecD [Candidatus Methanoperedenaceae archaeon]|nr:preprotein translocase subunit SecD [Candidatus Methanoperedenaceae archaeon]
MNRKAIKRKTARAAWQPAESEPLLKNDFRVLIWVLAVAGSLLAIFSPVLISSDLGTGLKYGLDLDGGTWLQLQLEGAVVQASADETKIISQEYERLLGTGVTVTDATSTHITFTFNGTASNETIDSLGYGSSSSTFSDNRTSVTLSATKQQVLQRFLSGRLDTEVVFTQRGDEPAYEIRKSVTEDGLNSLLKPVGGKVSYFSDAVTTNTRDDTKTILDRKLNGLGLKDIQIRPSDKYLLIDLAGVYNLSEAENIAATPGKFEIRLHVEGNRTEHVLYGEQIDEVGVPRVDERGAWGVPFTLNAEGAGALRDAAIRYNATREPDRHSLIMYLDDRVVYNATMTDSLAAQIQRAPVSDLVASTGTGGKEAARELQVHLRAGALPVTLKVIGSGQVSASLGEQFKLQLVFAGIVAVLAVAIIVALRYRRNRIIVPMLATSTSEVIIILGFASLPPLPWLPLIGQFFGWQLDLASITGIIAVVGTGIDHLIIITDEVLHGGKLPPIKIYKMRVLKAFSIILMAAATVFFALLPLLTLGFGSLKGFAITTIIGVIVGVGIARPAYARIIHESLKGELAVADEDEDYE